MRGAAALGALVLAALPAGIAGARAQGSIADPSGDAPHGADIVNISTAVTGELQAAVTLTAPLAADAGVEVDLDTAAGGVPGGGTFPPEPTTS
jgi:hypothetical protein